MVEDDPSSMVALALLLEREGYLVETAEDGLEALQVLEEAAPDLILLDLWMPRMDGWQFLVRLRQRDHPHRDVPVVALTADPRDQGAPLPVEAILRKPADMTVLLQTLRTVLERPGSRAASAADRSA